MRCGLCRTDYWPSHRWDPSPKFRLEGDLLRQRPDRNPSRMSSVNQAEGKEEGLGWRGIRFRRSRDTLSSAGFVSCGSDARKQLWWSSISTVSLLVLAVSALLLFVYTESRVTRHPTFDLTLFTENRLFAAANTAALLNYTAISGVTFMISIYLQDTRGFQPETAGLFLVAMSVAMALLSPLSGWMADKFGSRSLSTAGMIITTIGLLLLSQLNSASHANDIVLRLTLLGIGFGMFSSPNTRAIMNSVVETSLAWPRVS